MPEGDLSLRLLVDRCSVELFVNGGRYVMTNLVSAKDPYNYVSFDSEGGRATVETKAYQLIDK